MKRVQPLFLVGLIFSLIGALFAVLGGIFIAVSRDLLPQVFSAQVWQGETPDELAIPLVGLVFAGVGGLFLIIGVVMLLQTRRQRRLHEELLRFGTRVTGTVTDIRIDPTVRVNGVHPLRLIVQAQHPHTGEMKTLRGPRVWNTSLATGDAIDVLFDPQDEKRYTVELPGEPV